MVKKERNDKKHNENVRKNEEGGGGELRMFAPFEPKKCQFKSETFFS